MMAAMRFALTLSAIAGAGLLGAGGLYLGYLLGQTRYGRGKKEAVQTLFSRSTFWSREDWSRCRANGCGWDVLSKQLSFSSTSIGSRSSSVSASTSCITNHCPITHSGSSEWRLVWERSC